DLRKADTQAGPQLVVDRRKGPAVDQDRQAGHADAAVVIRYTYGRRRVITVLVQIRRWGGIVDGFQLSEQVAKDAVAVKVPLIAKDCAPGVAAAGCVKADRKGRCSLRRTGLQRSDGWAVCDRDFNTHAGAVAITVSHADSRENAAHRAVDNDCWHR